MLAKKIRNIFKNHRGSSSVELMMSVAIIGTVGAASLDMMNGQEILMKTRNSVRSFDVQHSLRTALELYYADHGVYPVATNYGALNAHLVGKYIDKIPQDPSGHQYAYSSDGSDFHLTFIKETDPGDTSEVSIRGQQGMALSQDQL